MKHLVLLLALLLACGDSTTDLVPDAGDGDDDDDDDDDDNDDSIDAGADGSADGSIIVTDGMVTIEPDGGDPYVCFVTSCEGHVTQCGNCTDDDGDGRVDSQDPECLGPCDNTEGPGLLAGVGGESGGPCKSDCYFDYGNGGGGGDCQWDHRCDPLQSEENGYNPEGERCEYEERATQRDRLCPSSAIDSASCQDTCRPLTPNGCDCFGCCTFPALEGRSASEGGEFVWLGSVTAETNASSCTLDDIEDPSLCRPCTPVGDCFNDCGECEICVGKPTLPADCGSSPGDAGMGDDAGAPGDGGTTDGGAASDGGTGDGGSTPQRCDLGRQPCGLPGEEACGPAEYCITGCCQIFY